MPPPSEEHLFGKKLSFIGPSNEGYTILPTAAIKMVRAPRRTQYFYNILLLIALSLILYLFSSQLLSQQQQPSGGGGDGSSNSVSGNSNNNVVVGRYSSSASSLSNDFNYQKTGQLSSQGAGEGNGLGEENNNNINIDDNDDINAILEGGNTDRVTPSGTTTGGDGEVTQPSKDWIKLFSVSRKMFKFLVKEFRD